MKVVRARAPLRIGLAGGGTDLANYSSIYGGAVFNATISMYSYCSIIPTNDNKIVFKAPDRNEEFIIESVPKIDKGELLPLHRGVYNRIVRDYNNGKALSFIMSTSSDAPAGSGLGTSSTMVVAILEAFDKWLGIGLNAYEKANLAYEIERVDVGLSGGKQDQYCAVFGGFNLMEFKQDGTTVINPLRVERNIINELECSLLLFYNGRSRSSADIIRQQIKNTSGAINDSVEAMHELKKAAYDMKDSLLIRDFDSLSNLLNQSWESKKRTSDIVSNKELDSIIKYAKENGAKAIKVSGAGGGGFIMMICDPVDRQELFDALKYLNGVTFPVKFSKHGVESWIND